MSQAPSLITIHPKYVFDANDIEWGGGWWGLSDKFNQIWADMNNTPLDSSSRYKNGFKA